MRNGRRKEEEISTFGLGWVRGKDARQPASPIFPAGFILRRALRGGLFPPS